MSTENKNKECQVVFQKNKYTDINTQVHQYKSEVSVNANTPYYPAPYTGKKSDPVDVTTNDSGKPQQIKKSRGKRLIKAIAGSAYNTIDDHTARHVRGLKAYHEHFILSTWNGFVSVYNDTSYHDAWLKVKWLDEERVPFRAVVNLVQKDNEFNVEESFSLLLGTLAVATVLTLIAFTTRFTQYLFSFKRFL